MSELLVWEGPETDVNSCCVATKFTIAQIDDGENNTKTAKGTITVKDYVEHGIVFTDPWEAVGTPQEDDSFFWEVVRPNDESAFWVNPDTQEAEFTLNSSVNAGMKRFVGAKLNEHLTEGRFIDNVEKYGGPRDKYEGPCVCEELEASNPQSEFDWEERTKKRFPQNCFGCSCGTNWWRCGDRWFRVADDAAWAMLLDHNGVEFQRIDIFKDGVYLLQTIRDKGFVPISLG